MLWRRLLSVAWMVQVAGGREEGDSRLALFRRRWLKLRDRRPKSLRVPVWEPSLAHRRPITITFPPPLTPFTFPNRPTTHPATTTRPPRPRPAPPRPASESRKSAKSSEAEARPPELGLRSSRPSVQRPALPQDSFVGRPLEGRYGRMVTFGDSYSDSQSLYAIFRPPSEDRAWPEQLAARLRLSRQLHNYAISGARSDRNSNVLGFRGGVLWQMDKFLEEKSSAAFYEAGALVGLQAGGINDFLLSPNEEGAQRVLENFRQALRRLRRMGNSARSFGGSADVVIVPLTMGHRMPLYAGSRVQRERMRRLYEPTSREMSRMAQAWCREERASSQEEPSKVRVWLVDAEALDREMREELPDQRPQLLHNWQVLTGELRAEDFMWWDSVHWSHAANRILTRTIVDLISRPPNC